MERLLYRVNESPKGTILIFSSIQWFVFTLANIITVPIVLGLALGLSTDQIALFTERSFFICGLIGLLQAIFGHRYPIIEGPAGMWWGVFLVLIQMTEGGQGSIANLLQEIELGLIIAGIVFIVLGLFGLLGIIRKLFTPVVTGVFLVLLALQISRSLIEGILGIGFRSNETVSPEIVLLSVILIAVTILMMFKGKGIIKSIAILIGLIFGWILYALLGLTDVPHTDVPVFTLPAIFPFGPPKFHLGVTITCAITALVLLSNLIASIQALGSASNEDPTNKTYNRGSLFTGMGTALAGMLGTVGMVPLAVSASLVSLTGIASRLPFIISSAAIAVLGLFPYIGSFVATLPEPVGFAILFAVFVQFLGFGLLDFKRLQMDQRDIFAVGIPLLTGAGIYFIPTAAWMGLPPMLGYLAGNGLIVGIVLALVMEHIVFRRAKQAV